MKIVTLHVDGMMCQHCVAHVAQALNQIDGVSAQVNLEQKQAVCTLAKDVPVQTLVDAVTGAGYTVVKVE